MPRPKKRAERMTGSPEVRELAVALRTLIEEAGHRTYQPVAKKANFSGQTIAEACRGDKRPSWPVTEKIVEACGGDLDRYRRLWAAAAPPASVGDDTPSTDRDGRHRSRVPLTAAAALTASGLLGWAVFSYTTSAEQPSLPTCDDIGVVMEGIDSYRWDRSAWIEAYERHGGREQLGCPVQVHDQGLVHRWGQGMSQDLQGPSGQTRLMALAPHDVFVMTGTLWIDYTEPHTRMAADWQGYPTSDPITCADAKVIPLDKGEHAPGAMVTSPSGRYIWLPRQIWTAYNQLGGPEGPLGRPLNGLNVDIEGSIEFEDGTTITRLNGTTQVRPATPSSPTPTTTPACHFP
ncbi:helix-turn-helix transcriptional regulator [Actinosynnema sp. NPDC023587]|uniref:helix-turn-helix domain-containing protein n=1 Tax=Actinosynnema sp. NPDC023587 TaxID=3154695 RepID=UPI0034014040